MGAPYFGDLNNTNPKLYLGQLSSPKIYKLGLLVGLFPIFGLDESDITGMNSLDIFSITNIIRFIWVTLNLLFLNIYLLRLGIKSVIINLLNSKFNLSFILITLIALGINKVDDLISWFRFFELSLNLLLIGICISKIRNTYSKEGVIIIFYESLRYVFHLLLIIFTIVAATSPSVAFNVGEDRGIRLGGAFIHPNTFALGCISYIISTFILLKLKRLKKSIGFISIFFSIALLIATKSSSGSLTFITILFIYTIWRLNYKIRIPMAFLFIILIPILINSISAQSIQFSGTWLDRTIIYKQSIEGILDNIWFGIGPFKPIKSYFEKNMLFSYWLPAHPHNIFLELLLSRGLFGGGFIISVILASVFQLIKAVLKKENLLIVGTLLIIFSIIFHGSFESSFANAVKPFCHSIFFLAITILHTNKKP
ncbi:O-antigen ligase family protein [Larkinella bovis]|uniref:O-antigen ligase family protein n=1 Tax=Larkinella bovis TaxID=683041 RepID=UPI0036D28E66